MRSVLKALVTVELQLCSDLFLSLGSSDGGKNEIDVLFGSCFVCNDTIVIEISNDRKVQETLSCLDVRNIRYPLLIRAICMFVLLIDKSSKYVFLL